MDLYCALAGFGDCIKIRSLVLARDDVSGARCFFLWVYAYFRHKNIRTKDSIECPNVRSSELDVHLFIQCCASAMLKGSTLLLYIRTEVIIVLLLWLYSHSWLGPGI